MSHGAFLTYCLKVSYKILNFSTLLKKIYLKKVHDENSEKILIEEWEPLLKQIPSEDIKQRLTMIFLKMYAENCAKKTFERNKILCNTFSIILWF